MTSFSEETQQQASAFDHIGENYEAIFGQNDTQISAVQWLIERLPAGAKVLDAGCGTGVPTAKMLVEAGFDVLGVDISTEMLAIAKRQVPNGRFELMDFANPTFAPNTTFQAITAFFSLLMLRKTAVAATLAKFASYLPQGGYMVLSMVAGAGDYFEIPFLGQPLHVSAYGQEEFTTVLQNAGFQVLDIQTRTYTPAEGAPPETQLFYFCQR